MLSYYIKLGIRSLSNQKLITIWMVLLIALGVAGSVSTFSLLRAVSSNPFAAKSHRLFAPQIDNHGPDYWQQATGGTDPVLTLRDVQAFRANDGAILKAAIYPINLSLVPSDTTIDPLEAKGYAVTVDYFRMLETPFQFGGAWNKVSDDGGSYEVVIGSELNHRKSFAARTAWVVKFGWAAKFFEYPVYLRHGIHCSRFYAAVDGKAFDPDAPQVFLPFRLALRGEDPHRGRILRRAFPMAGTE